MGKRIVALVSALSLSLSLALTGCTSGGSAPAEVSQPQASAPAQSEAQTDAAASDVSAQAPEALSGGNLTLDAKLAMPTGGLLKLKDPEKGDQVSEEEVSRMDRAMRDFTPQSDSLVINNAKEFYYYDNLDDETQGIYDAMMMVCMYPDQEDNYNLAFVSADPSSEEFYAQYCMAFFAMLYDHPELFWLYNCSETDIGYAYSGIQIGDSYGVYFGLSNPVENFEQQQTAFNSAVETFLSDIDTSAGEEEVAKQIHDKLISQVSYDMSVLEGGESEFANLAHTAYGALVENSNGTANCAVCDGYSLAYVYLLQQCGIDAVVIGGKAGSTEAEAGGHAWSMVKTNGNWHEVDTTWDDTGSLENQLTPDMDGYSYYTEALNDADYREKLDHYLYMVSTSEITHYDPDQEAYTYATQDGKYRLVLVFSSVHFRDTEADAGIVGALMNLAPIAE